MRRALLAGLVVACVGLAAGCSSSVAPRTWATTVCQSLAPWRATIADLNATAQAQMNTTKTVADTRAHVLALLRGGRAASEKARADIAAAGVPDVDGGAVIERRFVAALVAVRDAYGRAAATIQGLPTTDATAFYSGIRSAFSRLNADYAKAGTDPSKIASAELQADFAQVPACR